jgi:hypothetical protein
MASSSETPGLGRNGLLSGFADLDRIWRGELTRVSSLERGRIEIAPARLSMIIIFLGMIYGVCMGWVLRPFIGDPQAPVRFFRAGSWSNAYEAVIEMIWNKLTRRQAR